MKRFLLEHSDESIVAHEASECLGEVCCLHNRSAHAMRRFPQHWREDRGIMERVCEHGVGHPDPDDWKIRNGKDGGDHGCDGCCREKGPGEAVSGGAVVSASGEEEVQVGDAGEGKDSRGGEIVSDEEWEALMGFV